MYLRSRILFKQCLYIYKNVFFTNYIRIYGAIPLCAIEISHNSGIALLCITYGVCNYRLIIIAIYR